MTSPNRLAYHFLRHRADRTIRVVLSARLVQEVERLREVICVYVERESER